MPSAVSNQESSSGSDVEILSSTGPSSQAAKDHLDALSRSSKLAARDNKLANVAVLEILPRSQSVVQVKPPQGMVKIFLPAQGFGGLRDGMMDTYAVDFLGRVITDKHNQSGCSCAWVPCHVSDMWGASPAHDVKQRSYFNKDQHKMLLIPVCAQGHFSIFAVCHAGANLCSEECMSASCLC